MIGNDKIISSPSVEAKRNFSRELNKLRRSQQILTILVLLFVVMSFWIVVSLFSSQKSSKISPEVQKLAKPLTPTLDDTILDTITAKRAFTPEELANFEIFVTITDTATQTERVVPIGTAVLPSNGSAASQGSTATSSSQLQNVITTPAPTSNQSPIEEQVVQ